MLLEFVFSELVIGMCPHMNAIACLAASGKWAVGGGEGGWAAFFPSSLFKLTEKSKNQKKRQYFATAYFWIAFLFFFGYLGCFFGGSVSYQPLFFSLTI